MPEDQGGTVGRALDVLFHLHERGEPAGVTAIARALSMPKSSVHRLLGSLLERGLVERDERARYRPGIALLALGLGVAQREPIVVAARPVLEEGAETLGETLFVAAARRGRIVVLDKAEGTGFLRAAPRIGTSVPVHATAMGKLFLAYAPDEVELEPGSWTGFTDRTCTSEVGLRAEVGATRERGWASNVEEWIPGLAVVAAPVFQHGRMVAAVALAAPSAQLPAERMEEVAAAVGAGDGSDRREAGRKGGGMKVWIDGRVVEGAEARIPVTDHGLLYGDGIFEGIRVYGGRIFRLGPHLDRLAAGARSLGLAIPGGIEALEAIVVETVRAHGREDSYVRLIVTRGEGSLGVDPTTCPEPRVLCLVDDIALYGEEILARGLDLVTASVRKPALDALDPGSRASTTSTASSRSGRPSSGAPTRPSSSMRRARWPRRASPTCSWCARRPSSRPPPPTAPSRGSPGARSWSSRPSGACPPGSRRSAGPTSSRPARSS